MKPELRFERYRRLIVESWPESERKELRLRAIDCRIESLNLAASLPPLRESRKHLAVAAHNAA